MKGTVPGHAIRFARDGGPFAAFAHRIGLDATSHKSSCDSPISNSIQRERHRAHGKAARVGLREAAARAVPQLGVERGGVERHGAGDGGVVVVGGLDPEPARHQPALAEPAAQPLAQHPQQRMQHAEIVGVGGEGVGDVELGAALGRQHGARVDAAGPRPQRAAGAAEDGAERALGDGRDLADELELVVVEPAAHPGVAARAARRADGARGSRPRRRPAPRAAARA